MDPVLVFRHVVNEGPGYCGNTLDRYGIPWRLVAIDAGDLVPDSLIGISGLIFMGGPMSVNDPLPWLASEMDLIRQAYAVGLPVLGHCLGGQLIAKALGGVVSANPVREIGWWPVSRVANSAVDSRWLGSLPNQFEVFHWHGETFSLPPGAEWLLTNEHCVHQAFAIGHCLALQCHVEMTETMVQDWVIVGKEELASSSPAVQNGALVTQQLTERVEVLHNTANQLYNYWFSLLR